MFVNEQNVILNTPPNFAFKVVYFPYRRIIYRIDLFPDRIRNETKLKNHALLCLVDITPPLLVE